MKQIHNILKLMLLFVVASVIKTNAQIQLSQAVNSSTCALGTFGNFTVSTPSEVLSGGNVFLNITIPGGAPSSCEYELDVEYTGNLDYQTTGAVSMVPKPLATNTLTNVTVLPGNQGTTFNMLFKFPPYVTCNNTVGDFTVTLRMNCNGQEIICTRTVSVVARADNYWTITKQFVSGNAVCGTSLWYFRLSHNNPNPAGQGTYRINGNITETANLPVVSGANHSTGWINPPSNGTYRTFQTTLQNCLPQGSTITNTANFNFNLGDECITMNGSIQATSPPLNVPSGALTLSKYARDHSGYPEWQSISNFVAGCDAFYDIVVRNPNTSNMPFTLNSIQDNLNIPGITITNISLPSGWTSSVSGSITTFLPPSGTPLVLQPSTGSVSIRVYFTIDSSVPVGTLISNTATASYTGQISTVPGSSGSIACPGMNCPSVPTGIQNVSGTSNFRTEIAQAIPRLRKYIENVPNTAKLYNIGDIVEFKLEIRNSGTAPLNAVVSDVLANASQNLQFISSDPPIYYEFRNNPATYTQVPLPSTINISQGGTPSNPTWNINSIPGSCDLFDYNVVFIKFYAKVLPQAFGNKLNDFQLSYTQNGSSNTSTVTSDRVSYSIDQLGILNATKEADQDIVEMGDTFNYIINLNNDGSVDLDNLRFTDILPSCVQINGQVLADINGSSVNSATINNLEVTINPTTVIRPGESVRIVIPVMKLNGALCCNETVSASAETVNSNTFLTASFGSLAAPAACVTSALCCEIPGFDARINSFTWGGITLNSLTIITGSTPIQEIEVSLVDYHVEYSSDLCKPANMGLFGKLSFGATNLQGLTIQNNGTNSVSWISNGIPLMPSNQSFGYKINLPEILELECCSGIMYYCLKVRVKDVNCNVCERIICGTTTLKKKRRWRPGGIGTFHNLLNEGLRPNRSPNFSSPRTIMRIRPELKEALEKQEAKEEIDAFLRQEKEEQEAKESFKKHELEDSETLMGTKGLRKD
jgi:uncharacterized repeat protein (TIGR01451 family)